MAEHWFQSLFFGTFLLALVWVVIQVIHKAIQAFFKIFQKPEPKITINIKLDEKTSQVVATASKSAGFTELLSAMTQTMVHARDVSLPRPSRYDRVAGELEASNEEDGYPS